MGFDRRRRHPAAPGKAADTQLRDLVGRGGAVQPPILSWPTDEIGPTGARFWSTLTSSRLSRMPSRPPLVAAAAGWLVAGREPPAIARPVID